MLVRTNRPTILVVCSSPILRSVLREVLEERQYNVIAVSGVGGAVQRLKEQTPDLMIIRPYLINIDGYEAANYLRTKSPGMRVLMVSGTIDDDRLRYRDMLHRFEVFPKPFTAEELVAKVEEILAMPV